MSLQCIPWPVACSEWDACLTDFDRFSTFTFRFSGSGIRTIIRIGLKSWSLRLCPGPCRHAKFHPNPCTRFLVLLLIDGETDRQTDIAGNRVYRTSSFIGGKNALIIMFHFANGTEILRARQVIPAVILIGGHLDASFGAGGIVRLSRFEVFVVHRISVVRHRISSLHFPDKRRVMMRILPLTSCPEMISAFKSTRFHYAIYIPRSPHTYHYVMYVINNNNNKK